MRTVCFHWSFGFSLNLLNWGFKNFQGEMQSNTDNVEKRCGNHGGVCAICLDEIMLQETALVKGCEHAYWFVLSVSFLFKSCVS